MKYNRHTVHKIIHQPNERPYDLLTKEHKLETYELKHSGNGNVRRLPLRNMRIQSVYDMHAIYEESSDTTFNQ